MMKFITSLKLRNISALAMFVMFIASFVTQSLPASAFGEHETQYKRYNIYLYDKSAVSCGGDGAAIGAVVGGSETNIKIEKTETTTKIFEFLTKTSFSTNGNKPMTDAQAAGVMGNMYAESSLNPAAIESTTREQKGHGLVQWTFGRWSGPNGLEQFAKTQGKEWTDVDVQLNFLKKELESTEKALFNDTEFNATGQPAVAAIRFRVVFERANVALAHDDRREGAAISIYKLYGGTSGKANCSDKSGVVSGNLVKTALYFALDKPVANGKVLKEDAKITYQNEKARYNPRGDWSDCGGFIATVVIASGVDKDYPKLDVDVQREYVIANKGKYLVNMNPTLNDLKPGDILYTDSHTTMYTGEATYPNVDASWHERVPSVRDSWNAKWMLDHGAISARYVGPVTTNSTPGGGGGGSGI